MRKIISSTYISLHVFFVSIGPDPDEQLDRLAKTVAPSLRGAK